MKTTAFYSKPCPVIGRDAILTTQLVMRVFDHAKGENRKRRFWTLRRIWKRLAGKVAA